MIHKSFSVYFDETKVTSGQRFFGLLHRSLAQQSDMSDSRQPAVLFNVSAPISEMIKAKIRGQKVALRIDGLYFDRLSTEFISTFNWPLRQLLRLGIRMPGWHDVLAHVANFANQNYTAFARILLADLIIYQSQYSRDVYRRYFPGKPGVIVVNGGIYDEEAARVHGERASSDIELVTIYDGWKPAKRMYELIEFVCWAREVRSVPVNLTILGYNGKVPVCAPPHMQALIKEKPFIRTTPKFKTFSGQVRDALISSDIYITFTYRDPCPNVVVEAMSHGLPVVGMVSGGLPDIVGDAGVLLAETDRFGFFAPSRYERDFPQINFDEVLSAVLSVKERRGEYRSRVRRRFEEDLGIDIVAQRYAAAIQSML